MVVVSSDGSLGLPRALRSMLPLSRLRTRVAQCDAIANGYSTRAEDLHLGGRANALAPPAARARDPPGLAVGETVILLTPSLHRY